MEGIREAFGIKIYGEYLQFRERMLLKGKDEVYTACYKIDMYRNLYEIMGSLAARMSEPELESIYGEVDILGRLYENWLKVDDDHYRELERYVGDEILRIKAQGKDDDGNAGNNGSEAADGGGN